MQPYFIFNDIDSRDNKIIVNRLPGLVKATEQTEKITIPGRNGFLTSTTGAFEGIIKPCECYTKEDADINFISSWLRGKGKVIFSNEPDFYYEAVIINQLTFEKVIRQYRAFLIQFECQPFKQRLNEGIITLTSAGTILNLGTIESAPIIKVYGSGNITLTVNGVSINLFNVSNYVTIDSVLMDAYKDTVLKNNDMAGDFPLLTPGINNISWTGTVSKVEVTLNTRWL